MKQPVTGSLTHHINLMIYKMTENNQPEQEFYPVLEFGRADFENRYGYSKEDMTQEQLEQFIHLLNTEINEDLELMDRAWEIFDRVAKSVGLLPKDS